MTGAKRGQKEVENFLDSWNREKEKQGLEVRVVQLRTTGYMSLDFVVPDPGIDVARESEDEQDMRDALGGGIGPAE